MTATTRRRTTDAAPTSDWRTHAACTKVDPDLFFPTGSGYRAAAQTEEAKQVCGACPVRQECLSWALQTGQSTGIWGGMTERERLRLHRGTVSPFELCLQQQEYIETELAAGKAQRAVAAELGVGYYTVHRAIRCFRAERQGASAGLGAAA